MLLFGGRFVVEGHMTPVADLIRRVAFSAPQEDVTASLAEAYRGHTHLLHQTFPVVLTWPRSKGSLKMDGQELEGKAYQLVFNDMTIMPYGAMPGRCKCGAHPLNWIFDRKGPPVCCGCSRQGEAGESQPKNITWTSVDTLVKRSFL